MKTLRLFPSIIIIFVLLATTTAMRPMAPQASNGATILVTITNDEYGGTSTGCSLREAITATNMNAAFGGCPYILGPGGDVIQLESKTYDLSITGANENNNGTGDLDIAGDLYISGVGAGTIIQANSIDRVLDIQAGAVITLEGLIITGGQAPDGESGAADGGGIRNYADLTLIEVNINNNQAGNGASIGVEGAIGGSGGGIYSNSASLAITTSRIVANSAGAGEDGKQYSNGGHGGGLFNNYGTLTITDSTISNNSAGSTGSASSSGRGGRGGGCFCGGTISINGSTINGNTAGSSSFFDGGAGGGIYAGGSLTLINSTVSGNTSGSSSAPGRYPGNGGGLLLSSPAIIRYATINGNSTGTGSSGSRGGGIFSEGDHYITMGATILAGNSAPSGSAPDCYSPGTVVSEDYNLVGDPTSCTFNAPTGHSYLGVPGYSLPALADNGGLTQTHALLAGNQAIDQVPPEILGCGTTYMNDQRTEDRPDFSHCDMGAYELQTNYILQPVGFLPLVIK
jgi:CSLREA domain-containing protein